MTICMTHAEREALQFDLEACCLSLCLSVYQRLSLVAAYQITPKLQLSKRCPHWLKCNLNIQVNVLALVSKRPLMLKWKLLLMFNLGVAEQSSRGNGSELNVCGSCHTFVFWSGTHAGWSPRECVQKVTWLKDSLAPCILRTCSKCA